jgi:hypothetical protein
MLILAAWDFVVGEDWRMAIGVAVAVAVTALAAGAGIPTWWVMPAAALGLLALSIRRAVRESHLAKPREDSS